MIADHYGAGLVYDLPHAMSQINGQQLTRWGVEFDEAMDVALDNLRKISEQGFAGWLRESGGLPGVTITTPRGCCSST